MASLFELTKRRRQAKEWADKFRGGASPDELEYFDRFYQEPTASPIMQRGALEGELDMVDAIQRQLMARGMNALQAKDAAERAEAERKASLGTRAQDIATTRGPGGIGGTGEGSYEDYSRSQIPEPRINEFPEPPPEPEDWGKQQLSLEDWAMQRAIEQGMAGDISAESKARYDEQTVDDRIDIIEQQAAALPAELEAKGVSNEVTTKLMTEIGRLVDLAKQDPDNADTYIQRAQNLHGIVKARSGSTGFSSYTADQFISDAVDQSQAQAAAQGATVGQEGGQQLIAPRQTHIEGEYRR
jgi:hypothetical protein